jgi:hypothetical protein
MKDFNLRTYSGPFDWLTHALFRTRMELILNDFSGFLDLRDLVFLPKDPAVYNDPLCDYYENVRNGFYFYHDFKTGIDLDVSFPDVKKKYNRRIKRFYRKIIKAKHPLLIWLAHNQSTPDEVVKDLCGKVMCKFNRSIDFIIIENDANKKNDEIERIDISANIVRYNLLTTGFDEKGNPTTQGNIENCNKVFKTIRRKPSFWEDHGKVVIKISKKIKSLYKRLRRILRHSVS